MSSAETPERQTPTEDVPFVQRRVALFGLVSASLGLVFYAFRVVVQLALVGPSSLLEASMLTHLAATMSMGAIWLSLRSGQRSRRFIHTVESVGIVGSAVGYSLMGLYIPLAARPEMTVLMAMTYGLVARAVFVPSTAARTLVVTSLTGIPLIAVSYFLYRGERPLGNTMLYGVNVPAAIATGSAVWWLLTVLIATLTSKVIYGLRSEIRQAKQLGQYTLEQKLGEGGMGTVYQARHAMLRRPTAIKLLPPERAGESTIARFEREVQLTAQLSHPNTVTIYDYGRTPEGVFYYAMELLDGATLEQIVEVDGPQPPARVAHVLLQVTGSLAEAHVRGLIHRDIKPANILLCSRGGLFDVAKVVDFGLVKQVNTQGELSLTSTNAITGTPLYMSPEAIVAPDKIDGRSDLYALGAVGYFLLTGEHPFSGRTVVEVCSHHLQTIPEAPSHKLNTAIPEALEKLILQCLEKEQGDRPSSANELHTQVMAAGLTPWSATEARQWWERNADKIRQRRRACQVEASGRTLEVNLMRR